MDGFDPIALGAAPNDGDGDSLREAGLKLNAMLLELFTRGDDVLLKAVAAGQARTDAIGARDDARAAADAVEPISVDIARGSASTIALVAADLGAGVGSKIGAVSGALPRVKTVADAVPAIEAVAGSIAGVQAAAAALATAGSIASVHAVAGSIAGVNAVATDLALGGNSFVRRAPQAALDAIGARALAEVARDQSRTSAVEAGNARTTAEQARGQVVAVRDAFAGTAATAQAAVIAAASGLYLTISSGLAATAPNGFFYVASGGEVFTTLYQKVNGAAVLVNVLPSLAALDRYGRFVGTLANVDNATTINAALTQALVSGVILPAADIRLDFAIVMPSGKYLRGAGRGRTILRRFDNIAGSTYNDKAIVRGAQDASGVIVSDLSVIAPKVPDKVNGVWLLGHKNLVERIEAINCGYAFWAQGANDNVFRHVRSLNANVHFEVTTGDRNLFEYFSSADGDGDHLLGCEAHMHVLQKSSGNTFRFGTTHGQGNALLLVAQEPGFQDETTVDTVRSITTDGKICVYITQSYDGRIGKVRLRNYSVQSGVSAALGGGVVARIDAGDITWDGGEIQCFGADGVQCYSRLRVQDVHYTGEVGGYAYSAQSFNVPASIDVRGGSITSKVAGFDIAGDGSNAVVTIDQSVRISHPEKLKAPRDIGRRVEYVYPVDITTNGDFEVFPMVAGQPRPAFNMEIGTYRVVWRGQLKRPGTAGNLLVGSSSSSGASYGHVAIEDADGALAPKRLGGYYRSMANVPADAVRAFEMDVTFVNAGGQVDLAFGETGVKLLAGTKITIERIA